MAAYFALYSIGRLWIEALRIDEASNLARVLESISGYLVQFSLLAFLIGP
ncbi:MAG: hypothetical protein Ct9H90mP30_5450 [Actinomycetota bacterium]|nr:MAG: hypothetical protein Ct9H90mP30_5450 [Actinomycetota bacterium]